MEVVISVAAGCVSSARLTGWLALAATANVIHLFSASDGAMSDGFFHTETPKTARKPRRFSQTGGRGALRGGTERPQGRRGLITRL